MTNWRDDAACLGLDTSLFFPERGDNIAVREAKATCERCPVSDPCLLEHVWEREGIFGGSTPDDRRRFRLALGMSEPQDPKPMQPCGTEAAFRRHQRNSEVPCDACVVAYRDAVRARNARRDRRVG